MLHNYKVDEQKITFTHTKPSEKSKQIKLNPN